MGNQQANNNRRMTISGEYVAAAMKERKEEMEKESKILILGSGESGKSTIFKQIKILRNGGYAPDELLRNKRAVYSNVLVGIGKLVRGAMQYNLTLIPSNEERAERMKGVDEVVSFDLDLAKDFADTYAGDVRELWNDPAIQKAFELKSELHVEDCLEYFMQNLDRLQNAKYQPTVADMLHLRQKTLGVVEMQFEQYDRVFRFLDVGGQRNERKKWIHHFEDVTACIYVISMSDYNQNCEEDNRTNRMMEALSVFESVLTNDTFKKKPLILLFNKTDIFKQKLEKYPLYRYLLNYKVNSNYQSGIEHEYHRGFKFIENMFLSKLKSRKNVYTFRTCATDSKQMQLVLQCVEDIAFKQLRKMA